MPTPLAAFAPPVPPTPLPQSWMASSTLLTIYGRAFSTYPILGQLGSDNSFADLALQTQPYIQGIQAANGGKPVIVALHLIYAIANPCTDNPDDNCLGYLDDAGYNLIRDYIKPAARRGWLVVLDDQLGRSSPALELQHIIAKGYLAYDNVEVAFDPEFRTFPGQATPGIPIGSVTADEVNQTQMLLSHYATRRHLAHHKIIMMHQFLPSMIADGTKLRDDVPNVDLVVDVDGFGTPADKASAYTALLGSQGLTHARWPGIKLFMPNPYETAGHGDYSGDDMAPGFCPDPDPTGDRDRLDTTCFAILRRHGWRRA